MTEKVKTIEAYLADTQRHKERIKIAAEKLEALPIHAFNWAEQRKLDETRQGLLTEIRVLKRRIEEAQAKSAK